jgi:hypothetical protein
MNEKRRKAIEVAKQSVDNAKAEIEAIRDEEQEVYDNCPWRSSI